MICVKQLSRHQSIYFRDPPPHNGDKPRNSVHIPFNLSDTVYLFIHWTIRVAEVVRGHKGPPLKSLDTDENFKPEHPLFCRKLRLSQFTHFLEIFGQK